MSLGRLCIAAVLFFAATYIHLFLPVWELAAREPVCAVLDREGFALTVTERQALESAMFWLDD